MPNFKIRNNVLSFSDHNLIKSIIIDKTKNNQAMYLYLCNALRVYFISKKYFLKAKNADLKGQGEHLMKFSPANPGKFDNWKNNNN